MNVRGFVDAESRKLEIFMERIESGEYKPLGGAHDLSPAGWRELFLVWLASNPDLSARPVGGPNDGLFWISLKNSGIIESAVVAGNQFRVFADEHGNERRWAPDWENLDKATVICPYGGPNTRPSDVQAKLAEALRK